MRRSVKRLLLLVVVSFGGAVPSYAWNSFGHLEVAYLAYQKLTPATRARVWTLLQLNPDFATWEKTIPAGTSDADKKVMIFMIASIWADEIKNIAPYKDRFSDDTGKDPNIPPDSPTASQNIGYSDLFRHRYWHFIDVPFSRDATPLPPIPQPNAKTQIAAFRTALNSGNPDELKSYDLVWLLHLVGDLHQPLHCVTRIEHGEPDGDKGGNLVKCSNCEPSFKELHGFWDDLPGTTGNSPNYQEVINAAKRLPKPKTAPANDLDAGNWIAEGVRFAKSKVYKQPIDAGLGPFTLTAKYKDSAHKLARQRVALAGARLGNLLNRELK
jgi:S1/P1 Nuclease